MGGLAAIGLGAFLSTLNTPTVNIALMTVDSRTWVRFLAGEQGLLRALLTSRIRIKGPPRLLLAFDRCFPGS